MDLLTDERLHDPRTRYQYNQELEPFLSEALKKKTTQEWLEEFEPIGMPCGPLNGITDTAVDPLLDSRNMFVDLPLSGEVKGGRRVVNTPMKFSRTPALGEHTREVLLSMIGLKPEETESLEHQSVIFH